MPVDRLDDGTWVFAPYGSMLPIEDGARVVCHVCGAALAAISAQHARRHDLTLAGYRERFGLNRKQSLLAPALAETRRVEGKRRWAENDALRTGLAVGQGMARSGVLHELGTTAQPAGSRRRQGRAAASRSGASPALQAHRAAQSETARARWEERARELGFPTLDAYLTERRAHGGTAHRVRTELGCGGTTAVRLLAAHNGSASDPKNST
ncbi:MucR family transcriptional regulator [Nocardioides cavernae]|uniref:MucR family transcriptional regulator n=1 Tax=Nocardioides TaxID=1839 RepID=UPI000AA222A6|nr:MULTISPECIES: MucR family transcriptional regulator [Nocardioides]MCK9826069.1 MucR family transcriptional regulator [Nocardioides cavernae]